MPYQPAVLGPNARLNNFRLNYLTADQAADRLLHLRILVGGIDITKPDAPMRLLYKSMAIRDALFDAPNTCDLAIYGAAPTVGQPLEVWFGDPAVLLFSGEVQTVARTYKGQPTTVVYPVTAIDDTARANRKRPLGRFVNTSATTIAQWLVTTFAPGFSSAGVQANLPAVSITFDGSEAGMKGCLTALAKLIGGYWYFENKTLYLFVTPSGTPPDPIDDTPGRFLHDPAIVATIDKSQVRTRVYGKGASTRILAALDAGATLIPIENAEMFNPTGGKAIAAVVPDGAAFQIVNYTGVQLGGGGGLVGSGAGPSAAPGLGLAPGVGVNSGVHTYAIGFVTAAGETAPGPVGTIQVGTLAAPAAAPNAGTPTGGGAVDNGVQEYGVTFVVGAGETPIGPASLSVVTPGSGGVVTPPASAPTIANVPNLAPVRLHSWWQVGDSVRVAIAYGNANGVTTIGPISNSVVIVPIDPGMLSGNGPCCIMLSNVPISADPSVVDKFVYVQVNGAWTRYANMSENLDGTAFPPAGVAGTVGGPPATNTATVANARTVPVTAIPIGGPAVTARKLYRRTNGGPWALVDTIANNTTTSYSDPKAAASLGPAPPGAGTATANQVAVTIATGGAAVTARKIYRSAAGASVLQLLTTIANNTTTTHTDATPDASLGAAAPAGDTSGLTQPNGQVPAGSTSLIVANAGPFADAGGWAVIGNGDQAIRYSGKTATQLTGIPPAGSGAIVASVAYNSTVTAAPALVGVTGLVEAIIRNSAIYVWVQRDDLAAQSLMIAYDGGGDGVYEHIWSDERRSEASLRQVCDAQLALYSRPLVTVTYATRDLKTKSGKTVTIDLTTPAIAEALTIQDVAISEIGIRGLRPKFTVTASSVRQSLEAVLQMLIRKADA